MKTTTMRMAAAVVGLLGMLRVVAMLAVMVQGAGTPVAATAAAAAAASSSSSAPPQTTTFVWGVFPTHCFDRYVTHLDLFDVACFRAVLSKVLGYGIILGAVVVKLPQLITIVRARSAEGIAPSMFLLECYMYAVSAAYPMRLNNPFSTYGENLFLLVQGILLVTAVFYFNKQINPTTLVCGALCLAFIYSVFFVFDVSTLVYLQSAAVPANWLSRLPQIYANYKNGSTGQLSHITCLLNFAGTSARIFTTLQEVDSVLLLVASLMGMVLNGIILSQVVLYNFIRRKPATAAAGAKPAKSRKQE